MVCLVHWWIGSLDTSTFVRLIQWQREPLILTRYACVLIGLLLVPAVAMPQSNGVAAVGYWVTPNFSSIVRVTTCDDSRLCAELVWLYEVSIDGRKMLDKDNPDESLRNRPIVGLELFQNMKADAAGWSGRIYNPGDGRRYKASVTQPDRHRLKLRGCWGPFCKRQTWRRLSTVDIPTEAALSANR